MERTTSTPSDESERSGTRARQTATEGDSGCAASVQVALATFNSERFLRDLLDSLFAQTSQQFTLLVSDDGSTDDTLDILARYSRRYPGRIQVLPPAGRHLGPVMNFSRLLHAATADYLLLCDHDDVWLEHKIALSVNSICALEGFHGKSTPILAHTDLVIVGSDLRLIRPSFFDDSLSDRKPSDLTGLLTTNVATGCASVINRALYERARPIPPEAVMHDHWLALVAASVGAISFIAVPTILYRQHGNNFIGAASGPGPLWRRIRGTLFTDDRRQQMVRYSRQAAALLRRCGDDMGEEARRATETLARLWTVSRWRRLPLLWRSGLRLQGFVRNTALLIVAFRGRRIEMDE